MKTQIFITNADLIKLTAIMEGMALRDERSQKWLALLEGELDRAHVVESHEVPPDIITLHSKVCLRDLESGESTVYKLVLPSEADSTEAKLSALAPIGIAMLGYSEGDRFECETPGGVRRFWVERVLFQPEAELLVRKALEHAPHVQEKDCPNENAAEIAHQAVP